MYRISVITATFNSDKKLPVLIQSLQKQTDKKFEWIVVDGGSKDRTLDLLKEINDLDYKFISESDFGIYDALNKGIMKASGDFYLVIGSDDYLFPDAIENFKSALDDTVDVVAASVNFGGKIKKPGSGKSWLKGQFAYVAGHSTATLFRKSLHDKFGLYSRSFPIAADQLFINTIFNNNVNCKVADFVSGFFTLEGVSATDVAGTLSESFRVQLITEKSKLVQLLLFLLRLLKNFRKL